MRKHSKNSLFLALSVVLFFTLALTGCGAKNNNTGEPQTSTPPAQSGTNDSTSGGADNLLSKIKAAGVIQVGVIGTYPPYNFLNENKEIDGFDADIAKEIAKRLGVKAEFHPQEFSGLIPSLQASKIDTIISQVTITDERKQQIDFTQPYITNTVKIIVGRKQQHHHQAGGFQRQKYRSRPRHE